MTNPETEIYYVWAAYGAALLIVAGVILWTLIDAWQRRRELADLEARGIRRRSAAAAAAGHAEASSKPRSPAP